MVYWQATHLDDKGQELETKIFYHHMRAYSFKNKIEKSKKFAKTGHTVTIRRVEEKSEKW